MSKRKVDAAKLPEGAWVSRCSLMKLETKQPCRVWEVRNTEGVQWNLDMDIMSNECYSADQFDRVQEVTRTEMAHQLHTAGNDIFKVRFLKTDGTERVLRGALLATEDLMGRAQVIDVELPFPNNERQVDYRTLQELVLRGVCYRLKNAPKSASVFVNNTL